MIVLSCTNIWKSYVVEDVLKDISFSIEDKDKIGLIGLNGSGKTTLFNILTGEIERDKGDIYIQKNLKIGYLKQHVEFNSQETVFNECLKVFDPLIEMEKELRCLEEKMSSISIKGDEKKLQLIMKEYSQKLEEFNDKNGYGYKSEINGVLKGLGFNDEDMKKNIDVLSGGQKARLSLAKLLLEKPDLLLLDEPTNHLDIEAIRWLEGFLKDYKGAAIIISHDRYFLDNIVNKIFNLENHTIKVYNTNYTGFMKQRKMEMEIMKRKYENQQKEIKRQEEIIKRFLNYGGKRYIKQAQSRQKLLEKMKTTEKPLQESKKFKLAFTPKIISGKQVLQVENLGKRFGDFKLLEGINFNIYRGEKVGLIGPNGVGKTTLFKMILKKIPHDEGNIFLGHGVNIGYFDQEQKNLNLNKTVIDEIWDDNPNLDHFTIRKLLGRFLFIGDDIFKLVEELSGGERNRLSLLKMMLSNSNFLLMDEPTNHLDIDSKEVLEEALIDYEGTLLVISHDRYFLNRVVNKILELTEEGIKEYLGNYDYYLEKKNEVIVEDEEENTKTKTQIKQERRKEKELLIKKKKRKKEIQQLEETISKYEEKINKLDNELCNPSLYDDHKRILELNKEREQLKLDLDKLYDKWMKLTEDL